MNIKLQMKKSVVFTAKWSILIIIYVLSIAIFPLGFFMVGFWVGRKHPSFKPLQNIRTYRVEKRKTTKELEKEKSSKEKKSGIKVV